MRILDIQTANGFLVSVSFASKSPHKGTWRFSVGISGGSLCVRASVGNATSEVTLIHDLQERLSGYPEVKALDCSIENFVFAVAVTRQKAVPSKEDSSATGNREREKDMENTMMELLRTIAEGLKNVDADSSNQKAGRSSKRGIEEHPLNGKPCFGGNRCGWRYSGKGRQKKRKESSAPTQEEITTCSFMVQKIRIAKYAKR